MRFDLIRAFCTILAACSLPAPAAAAAEQTSPSFRERVPGDEVIYFLLPDRFENGDPSNDRGGLEGDRYVTGFDPTSKAFYNGGDLRGLIDRLDYIQSLGATAIWLGPIYKNRPVQGNIIGSTQTAMVSGVSAGYHGYWVTDFTRVDPHFGEDEDMRALVEAVHSRGMKIYLDIITNHTADILTYEEGTFSYRNKTDFPYRMADGTPFEDRDYAGGDTFPPLDPAVSFPYTPVVPADAPVKVPDWLNNPIYYHNRGNSSFSGENSLYGDFFGLDDLWND